MVAYVSIKEDALSVLLYQVMQMTFARAWSAEAGLAGRVRTRRDAVRVTIPVFVEEITETYVLFG
jgi:hypothetical protein